jgi:mono/diheme cytochrome c family protein
VKVKGKSEGEGRLAVARPRLHAWDVGGKNMKITVIALLLVTLAWSPGVLAANPREAFLANCASCHGKDGRAQTPMGKKLGVKNLAESRLVAAEIEKQILAGVKDAKGAVKMPAFGERLSKEEVSELAAFVKSLQQ